MIYRVKQFFKNIKRCIKWGRKMYTYQPWDYTFYLQMQVDFLYEMKKDQLKTYGERSIVKQIQTTIDALERLIEPPYIDIELAKAGIIVDYELGVEDANGLYSLTSTNSEEESLKIKDIFKYADSKQKEDLEIVAEAYTKGHVLRWWS